MSNAVAERGREPRSRSRRISSWPDLVRERLARPDDVAVDLVGDVVLAPSAVWPTRKSIACCARPAERVDARVDDEPAGAPGVVRQDPEAVHVRAVEAHLVGQALRVQAPALAKAVEPSIRWNAGRPVSSWATAIWRWWPGTASWKASASAS